MGKKISVLDVQIDNCTAKEAMQKAMAYIRTEPLNVVELVTADVLIQAGEIPELKQNIECLDLVLAGERTILEGVGITDRRILQDVERQMFLRMFFRFLHKNHNRVFLLSDTKDDAQMFSEYLVSYYESMKGSMEVVGMEIVPNDESADDMIINSINGAEVDCIIALLTSPKQEAFVQRNRQVLNAKVWIGVGQAMKARYKTGPYSGWLKEFLTKRIFKKELEKEKRKKDLQ